MTVNEAGGTCPECGLKMLIVETHVDGSGKVYCRAVGCTYEEKFTPEGAVNTSE